MRTLADRLRATVREVPDFPKPGILFKEIGRASCRERVYSSV